MPESVTSQLLVMSDAPPNAVMLQSVLVQALLELELDGVVELEEEDERELLLDDDELEPVAHSTALH